jgi:hypothetical protein
MIIDNRYNVKGNEVTSEEQRHLIAGGCIETFQEIHLENFSGGYSAVHRD